MVWTSLSTVRTSIADVAKAVYVDKTDVVEEMLGIANMFDMIRFCTSSMVLEIDKGLCLWFA